MGIPFLYDKEFLTLDEQVVHLKEKHCLHIDDNEFAKNVLSTFSYYDLINGYKKSLMDGEAFRPGISIEFLYLFYLFDKNFQNIIFKYSLLVENAFKTRLSYYLAGKFSEHESDYLSTRYYRPAVNKHIVFNKVVAELYSKIRYFDKAKGCYVYTQYPVKHYAETHNHIPPWILMKNISFGNAINLYRLLQKDYKEEFTNSVITHSVSVSDKINFLTSLLNLVREFRNVIAHNLKFVDFKQDKYQLPLKTTCSILNNSKLTDDIVKFNNLYGCIIGIYLFLPLPILRKNFTYDLARIISDNPTKSIEYQRMLAGISDEYFKLTELGANFSFIDKLIILANEADAY